MLDSLVQEANTAAALPESENNAETTKETAVSHASGDTLRQLKKNRGSDFNEMRDVELPSPFLTEHKERAGPGSDDELTPWIVAGVDVEAKIVDGVLGLGLFAYEAVVGGEEGMKQWFDGIRDPLDEAGDVRG